MKKPLPEFSIAGRPVGPDQPPFIIAEMSGNHNQSIDRALAIVDAAAEAGVDALKIQTYTADTMTLDLKEGEFFIDNPNSLWKGESLYDLYKKAYTPWEWHQPIFDRCRQHGIIGFSSPFDFTAVDFLETLDVPLYKIASFELVDLPLIRKVAATGKPMIMSTGMATVHEIQEAVQAAWDGGCQNLILLKCTSTYPADPGDSNLLTIPHLGELFNVHVGLSDHTLGIGAGVAATVLGAVAIEKHFTLDRSEGGVDSTFSLEPHEMKMLVQETKTAKQALGGVHYGLTDKEIQSQVFRRSLYVTEDMTEGQVFNPENMRSIRPGYGLPPKFYDEILGKKATRPIKRGTPLYWDLVSK